jgi:hypothetical protein
MNATYATSIFTKILNVNNAVLYVVLHVSIGFILVTTTAAQYAGFNVPVF